MRLLFVRAVTLSLRRYHLVAVLPTIQNVVLVIMVYYVPQMLNKLKNVMLEDIVKVANL